MKKKYLVLVPAIFVIILASIWFISEHLQDRYYPEMSYKIVNYEEVPEVIKNRIDENLTPNRTTNINGSGEVYIVIVPAENKSVEILSIGKNENAVNGLTYRYRYADKVSDNILENIKIIKVINFNGNITGSFTSN